jgi:hypothetical protein
LRKGSKGFFVILGLGDDHPLFDVATGNGTAGLGIPLNMVVGKVDEDGDLISPLIDCRRFEPVPEEVLRRR